MRHLRSILYALVLAPAAWILTGVGFTDGLHGRARVYSAVESFTGLLLLLLAGAAYAILILAPISPAGPALIGLAFLGVSGWALASPASYAGVWPAAVTKSGFDLSRPGYGLAALLAVPLVCTALSARRWERYEPPQLPLIGTLGRHRGAAAVAGTPVATMTTQILTPAGSDQDAAEATQVIRPTGEPEPATGAVATQAVPVTGASAELAGTESGTAPDEPVATGISTEANPSAEPAATGAADEPVAEEAAAEPVAAQEAAAEPAAVNEAAAEGAESVKAPNGDETGTSAGKAEPVKAPVGEKTTTIAGGDDEKTQVIRLSVGEMPTRELTEGPGERTQVIRHDHRDDTQVIKIPQQRSSPDGERTQVIRAGTGTVDAPGDRTQVVRMAAQDTPGEPPTVGQPEPSQPASIVAEERPDPGTDPTTRIEPPQGLGVRRLGPEERRLHPDEQRGAGATVEVANGKRPTVTNLERPADEAANDQADS